MSKNEEHYGNYVAGSEANRPFSKHLTVEAGEGTKGRPKPNTVVELTALPGFIQRMRPTKVGKHKNKNVDGIVDDHFTELAEDGEQLDGIDRHLGAMMEDPNSDVWDL